MNEEAKEWIQENLRVIVSMFIVSAIALGIYSYSQREYVQEEVTTVEEESPRKKCFREYGEMNISAVPAKCVRYFK